MKKETTVTAKCNVRDLLSSIYIIRYCGVRACGVLEILTEELGDGHVERNHVFLYQKLLPNAVDEADGSGRHVLRIPPTADSLEFVEKAGELGMGDPQVWKAATAQLLISLFPYDFMPEVLGFNLQYEPITLQTLAIFVSYLQVVREMAGGRGEEGKTAVQEAWRRIQAGYVL
ncbi:hypothetical protein PG997_002199 [Apiospora hydei]|uniref:Uncharacterized protein n=1 Tax=Apiospora hydei TaxID=1337664 RepID=A0ABR1X8U2_9PEZI